MPDGPIPNNDDAVYVMSVGGLADLALLEDAIAEGRRILEEEQFRSMILGYASDPYYRES